jgi:hypothetical protein
MSTPRWCFAWQKVLYFSFVSAKKKKNGKNENDAIKISFTRQRKSKANRKVYRKVRDKSICRWPDI